MLSGAAADTRAAEILDHCSRRVCDPRRTVPGEDPGHPGGEGGDVRNGDGGGGGGGGGGTESGGAMPGASITTIDGLNNVPRADAAVLVVSEKSAPETAPSGADVVSSTAEVLSGSMPSSSPPDITRRAAYLTINGVI